MGTRARQPLGPGPHLFKIRNPPEDDAERDRRDGTAVEGVGGDRSLSNDGGRTASPAASSEIAS